MENQPSKPLTISVISPSFNQAEFLPACLESIASQTYAPIEHFVFDPGSSDGSREIVTKFPHATLRAEPDKGQADAIGKGMLAIKGDIIGWLNSDDLYADNQVFADVIARFSEPDAPDIVYGRAIYIGEFGEHLRDAYVNEDPSSLPWRLQKEVGIVQPALFMRRTVVEKIGIVSESLNFCMDYEYWIRAMKAGLKFAFLPRVLAHARYYTTNKTFGKRGDSYREICDTVKEQFGYVPVDWLRRYAEFTVEGYDGIVYSSAQGAVTVRDAVEREVRRLLVAYNTDYNALEILNKNKNLRPYNTTIEAMKSFDISLESLHKVVPMETKSSPGAVLYTVGERRWAINSAWKQQQIERTRINMDIFRDERQLDTCVIVGNGPSLNDTDLTLLQGHDVFITNYAFLNKELRKHAKYLAVVNYLVAEQGSHHFNQLQGIRKLFPYWLGYCIAQDDDTYFLNSVGYEAFSKDINENVSWRSTVTFFQQQIAYWLGYKRVLMIGFDHNYTQDVKAVEGDILLSKEDDVNHFDPRYFKNKRWQAADVDKMEAMYQLAKEAYESDGREIINCTVGGKLEIFRRGDLKTELEKTQLESQGLLTPEKPNSVTLNWQKDAQPLVEQGAKLSGYPRVLVIDMSKFGALNATGQMKKIFFTGWPSENLLQVYAETHNEIGLYSEGFPLQITRSKHVSGVMAEVQRFKPDVIYYRPLADRPNLHEFAMQAIDILGVPLVTQIMDDWPERLKWQNVAEYRKMDSQLRDLLSRSVARLGICDDMSDDYEQRYGYPFIPVANCIDENEWSPPDFSEKMSRSADQPFIIRYMGALASDMNFESVRDIAQAVDALQSTANVQLEIYTMPFWKKVADEATQGLRGVSIYDAQDGDAYYELLRNADALIVAYNFDEVSVTYTRYSLSNKMPECMAAGVPVLAYGSPDVASIKYALDTRCMQVVTERAPQKLQTAILELVNNPDYCRQLGESAYKFVMSNRRTGVTRGRFHSILRAAAAVQRWTPNRTPAAADDPGISGLYTREDKAAISETDLISDVLADMPAGSILLDVGAHHGGSLKPFLERGWRIYAFEPDPNNRAKLLKSIGDNPQVIVDERAVSDTPQESMTFYTSQESTGISTLSAFMPSHQATATVAVTTLTHVVEEHNIEKVDFLKIDTEGFDFFVLKGFPWDRLSPTVIECEFEDKKTISLGYEFHEFAQYLMDKGYAVFVSEWHPIVRYGTRHDWRRMVRYPAHLGHKDAWGNLLAIRDQNIINQFMKVVQEQLPPKAPPKPVVQPTQAKQVLTSSSVKGGASLKGRARRARTVVKDILKFYSRWTGIVAAVIILSNMLATFDTPLSWLFSMIGNTLLLLFLAYLIVRYRK